MDKEPFCVVTDGGKAVLNLVSSKSTLKNSVQNGQAAVILSSEF